MHRRKASVLFRDLARSAYTNTMKSGFSSSTRPSEGAQLRGRAISPQDRSTFREERYRLIAEPMDQLSYAHEMLTMYKRSSGRV